MRRRVIVNTSPLFYLHRVKYLDCLEKLYGEIIIPDAVVTELEEGKNPVKMFPGFLNTKVEKVGLLQLTEIVYDDTTSYPAKDDPAMRRLSMNIFIVL